MLKFVTSIVWQTSGNKSYAETGTSWHQLRRSISSSLHSSSPECVRRGLHFTRKKAVRKNNTLCIESYPRLYRNSHVGFCFILPVELRTRLLWALLDLTFTIRPYVITLKVISQIGEYPVTFRIVWCWHSKKQLIFYNGTTYATALDYLCCC